MSQSTSIDINYISCSNNVWGQDEGSDHSIIIPPISSNTQIIPSTPSSYASALKLADNSVISLSGMEVVQCTECTVDINNHTTANISGTFGTTTPNIGNQTFSVKGGSTAIINGTLKGIGNRGCDILIDNWSDQSYNGSTVDLTNAVHEEGRKLKAIYRFFASTIHGTNVDKLYFKSTYFTCYWWLKWIVRKILGIKVGQKGPSWL